MKPKGVLHQTAAAAFAFALVISLYCSGAGGRAQRGPDRAPWPKAHGNIENSGIGPASAATGRVAWTFAPDGAVAGASKIRGEGEFAGAPSVGADGTVYFGSYDCGIYALDGKTGKLRWVYRTLGRVSTTPALGANGLVYAGSSDGRVYALDAASGEPRWIYRAQNAARTFDNVLAMEANRANLSSITASLTIGTNGRVYADIAGTATGLTALDGQTGRVIWKRTDGGVVWGCPALTRTGALIEPFSGIRAIDASNGSVRGSLPLPGEDDPESVFSANANSPAIGPDGTIYLGRMDARGHGQLFALSPDRLRLKWKLAGGQKFSTPAIGMDGALYAGRGHVHDSAMTAFLALDGRTGRVRWSRPLEAGLLSAPALSSDGTIYVCSSNGSLYAIEAVDGRLKWKLALGVTSVSNPAIGQDGTVYVGSADNRLYAIR